MCLNMDSLASNCLVLCQLNPKAIQITIVKDLKYYVSFKELDNLAFYKIKYAIIILHELLSNNSIVSFLCIFWYFLLVFLLEISEASSASYILQIWSLLKRSWTLRAHIEMVVFKCVLRFSKMSTF